MRILAVSCLLVLLTTGIPPGSTATLQDPELLPPWSRGTLDIHHISTGRGNATFFIFPDGTTLLVDAGAAPIPDTYSTAMPNDTRAPGEWIARYIAQMHPDRESAALDYALVTHFHGDHMGVTGSDAPMSRSGSYRLSGITEVAEYIPVGTMMDRGWPDYDYPVRLESETMDNYRAFLDWRSRQEEMQIQRFQPGRTDQIVLRRDPSRYPEFEIRNLTANGEVWTGRENLTSQQFPPLETLAPQDFPSENMSSISFMLTYGQFEYFTGGDLTGIVEIGHPEWQNMETAVSRALGPLEVHVVNHHGSIDPASPPFLAALRPRVHIIPAWSVTHPAPSVLKRLLSERAYPGPRDVFIVRFREETQATIGDRALQVKSGDGGHIVVRVEPGGGSYRVLVLDDSAETYTVESVHGPYDSR